MKTKNVFPFNERHCLKERKKYHFFHLNETYLIRISCIQRMNIPR